MAQKTIDRIREAEKKAQRIVKEAESDSKALIEKAISQSEEASKSILTKATTDVKDAVEKVALTRDDSLEAARRRAMSIIAQYQVGIEEKKDRAVDLVIAEIT
ncbi:MAG: hypothetical protein ACOX75_02405 [Lachnospiraceae bacterium]|jgi:vacuolar-type H+-ATPase subunit H